MARLYRHPTDPTAPDRLVVPRASCPATVLLSASAPEWQDVASIRWGHDDYRTRLKLAWTADALALRFDCDDDRPWATLTERDSRLWLEEVVEIFLDPAGEGRHYAEVEVSPANIVCDLRVATPWPELSAEPEWHWEGLASAVSTESIAPGRCRWAACLVLPFQGLDSLSAAAAARLPPSVGDCWKFNAFRIKRPHGPADPDRDVIYAAWSMPGGPSFHDPEAFRTLVFGG